jgi:xanthine/CO dehydrogenase XdhC/CoxF family maturation factor
MKSRVPVTVRYDSTSDEDIIFGTGLGCNGIVDVFVEPLANQFRESLIKAVRHCHQTRQHGAIATIVKCGENFDLSHSHAFLTREGWTGNRVLTSLLADNVPQIDDCVVICEKASGADIFIQPLLPPIQLVVFGGGFDVAPLIHIAKAAGFQTVVIDSRQRPSWAQTLREADSVMLSPPDEALPQIHFDSRTVAVVMNHHFESDRDALAALTQVRLPYLGLLGPKRRREKLLDAVKRIGGDISDEFVEGLHGPAGLDIGAKNPEQIALSIMAEILAVLNQRNAKPVRERLMPLHVPSPSLAYA